MKPMLSRTWHWLMPLKLYSTGSSAVMIFLSGRLSSSSAVYRVVVFARPRWSGDQEDAIGAADHPVEDVEVIGLKTKVGQTDLDRVGPQNPKDDRTHRDTQGRRDPEVNLGLVHLEFDAAILRMRFSAMLMPAINLRRASTAACILLGRLSRTVQTPSMR